MADRWLAKFINKRVGLRFWRQSLQFDLSQSLFSSFDIDAGTRLLLKSLAQEVSLTSVATALDVGCGVGVLGLCLQQVNPAMSVVMQDRDALATAVSRHNAHLNRLPQVIIQDELGLQGVDGRTFDLIVSNLPGKAGPPVLRHLLGTMPAYLTPGGRACVVIVRPLAELVAETLAQMGGEVLYREEATGYVVFHFRGGQPALPPTHPLQPYWRGKVAYKSGAMSVPLTTVYDLPAFDTPSYDSLLAINILPKTGGRWPVNGRVLIWNPGQGHLPAYVYRSWANALTSLTLAGRDRLSLEISRYNVLAQGAAAEMVQLAHVPHLWAVDGRYDWIIAFPEHEPGVPWTELWLPTCADLLMPAGHLLLTTRSTYAFRLLEHPADLHLQADRKKQGFRTLLFVNS